MNDLIKAEDLNIVTGMQFDKQDIVTVAIARGESKIRQTIRELQKQAAELTSKMNSTIEEIIRLGREYVAAELDQELILTRTAAGILGSKTRAELQQAGVNTKALLSGGNKQINTGMVLLIIDKGNLVVKEIELPATKAQLDLVKLHNDLQKKRDEITEDAIRWKKKLADMPAFERQMRAVVVEDQLNKTEKGKAILEALEINFDKAIESIG